ncbi:MerC domain-containing protein [Idiomarina sp. HP20-50]|uniref:MerC domain-containing protein n=1 Tax=Idiomarina sp. HP20-50 TaxID=3070813 RepID=UPI00294B2017|nr:MerC domain-containing protein [Idiomarina sp. HP20-50]MDV6317359.1 MerC domain-containing protein [Idiomarina sp. HP20-50]
MNDRLGMFFSGLCFCHCLATPLLIVLLGTNSLLSTLETELLHQIMLLPVLAMGLYQGYYSWRNPRAKYSRILLTSGCILVISAQFFQGVEELLFTVIGSVTLISGHFLHLKHERCSG